MSVRGIQARPFWRPRWVCCSAWPVLIVLVVLQPRVGIGQETIQRPIPEDILSETRALADKHLYVQALDDVMLGLETCPDGEWAHDDYWRALVRAYQWFGKVSPSDRASLLHRYANPAKAQGRTQEPFFNLLTRWMHDVLPGTSLQSPGAKLTLAGWHWQMGNYPAAFAQAMGVIQMAPNSLAAEYGARALILGRLYRHDFDAGSRDAQIVGGLMPNTKAAGWAVAQLNWWHGHQKRLDSARELNHRVINRSPGTLVSDVSATMLALIGAIEAGQYARAIELLEYVRPYNRLTEPRVILGTFTSHLDWSQRRTPAVKVEIDELERAAIDTMANGSSPYQRKFARLLLARVYEAQWKTDEAVALLEPLTVREEDDDDFELRAHALAMIGVMLFKEKPRKALEALEAFADDYMELPLSDNAILILGALYLKAHRYQEALDAFRWVQDRNDAGVSLWPAPAEQVTAGMAGALWGLGRVGEAWRTIRPVIESMPPDKLQRRLMKLSRVGFKGEVNFLQTRLAGKGRLTEQEGRSMEVSPARRRPNGPSR